MSLTVDQALVQAVEAHRSGQLQDAERLYRAILEAVPRHSDANHNLGLLAISVGKPVEALPYLRAALEAAPAQGQFWISYVQALIQAGRLPEAREILAQGRSLGLAGPAADDLEGKLGAEPARDDPPSSALDALTASFVAENFAEAEAQARALTIAFPDHPFGWKVLGASLSVTGRYRESLAPMRESIRLQPDAETCKNLAIALLKLGEPVEAEQASRQALALWHHYAEAHLCLGNALLNLGRSTEAEWSYREALRFEPVYAQAHINLGAALRLLGRVNEAEASVREALKLEPADAFAHYNLGMALMDMGRLTEAEEAFRQALAIDPGYLEARSNLLFCLNYSETLTPASLLGEARQQGAVISAAACPKFTAWKAALDPTRLKVGFVSGDLRSHPVGYFLEGLLEHLDPSRFELIAFPTTGKVDNLTRRISPRFQAWLPLVGLNDREAAAAIHEQGVHVLVDLSGHTADNRLSVFAYRPAPVQVSWLGYFATTGLPEMDYFLGDHHMATEAEQRRFTETLWRLPETWLCSAPYEQPVSIGPPPALANGFVTFGCLGNLSKMNGAVVALWSQILLAVPGSKLLLKAKPFVDPQAVADVQARFARHGVASDRLVLEGPSSRIEYFETYNRIDLVLDTFPYPGGTTSVDALWMGAPVLTLEGDRFLARLGESIARNAGQFEWIARDREDYLDKAVAFAASKRVAYDRTALRRRVLTTPLFDTERFARGFGEALWGMWREGGSRPG